MRTVGSAWWLAALPGAPLLVEPTRGRDRAGPHATWCPAADTLSRFDLTPAVAEKSHHLERGLMKCQMTESTGPGRGPEGPWGAPCPTCLSVPSPCKGAAEGPEVLGFTGSGSQRCAIWFIQARAASSPDVTAVAWVSGPEDQSTPDPGPRLHVPPRQGPRAWHPALQSK